MYTYRVIVHVKLIHSIPLSCIMSLSNSELGYKFYANNFVQQTVDASHNKLFTKLIKPMT